MSGCCANSCKKFCKIILILKIILLTIQFVFNSFKSFIDYSKTKYIYYPSELAANFYVIRSDASSNAFSFSECILFKNNSKICLGDLCVKYYEFYVNAAKFSSVIIIMEFWIYFVILLVWNGYNLYAAWRYDEKDQTNDNNFSNDPILRKLQEVSFDTYVQIICCGSLFFISKNNYSKPCIQEQIFDNESYQYALGFSMLCCISVFLITIFFLLLFLILYICHIRNCINKNTLSCFLVSAGCCFWVLIPFMIFMLLISIMIFILNFFGTLISIFNSITMATNLILNNNLKIFQCCKKH